jgi:dolichol-phosphate mannosyltransferase
MRVVAAIGCCDHEDWLGVLNLDDIGIQVATLYGQDGTARTADSRVAHQLRLCAIPGEGGHGLWAVPEFSELCAVLQKLNADACLLFGAGIFERLVALAADHEGLAVFELVCDREQLRNLRRRAKPRPDLYFLADEDLFEEALTDPRYGSTLIPTGHPRFDGPDQQPSGDTNAGRFGFGQASQRIKQAMMQWRDERLPPETPELSVVVPAFKEARNLPTVCDNLVRALARASIAAEVLVVDDFSPDDTYQVARRQMWHSPMIRAFTKTPPRGMGNAIKHGLSHARAPIIAITMGDGSDDVASIPHMFHQIRDHNFGLVIGCRYRNKRNYENVPLQYRFWSRSFRLVTKLLIGANLLDYTNAFRAFHRRALGKYGLDSGGFEISPEITFKAWFFGQPVGEVDVQHLKRASGQSNFSFLRAGPGYGKILTKAIVCRLTHRWFTLDW